MKLRKNFIPKTLSDFFATLFVLFFVPALYFYEILIVLPTFNELGSSVYMIHIILGTFVMSNVLANFFATALCDTSIKGEFLQPNDNTKSRWRLCLDCEILSPPRSWHCKICDTCILKRDHHCIFTGYCVGHRNQRYFFMMVFYCFIGAMYATWFSHWFVWQTMNLLKGWSVFKLVFPLAMLAFDSSAEQVYLVMYILGIVAVIFTGILIVHHGRLIYLGSVDFERQHNLSYNKGLKKNIESVFGKRWYLTWISPLIKSPLPQDGINWDLVETPKTR